MVFELDPRREPFFWALFLSVFSFFSFPAISSAQSFEKQALPDWSEGALVPPGGRSNPYHLSQEEYPAAIQRGKLHALHWPVEITGALLPFQPIKRIFDSPDSFLQKLLLSFWKIVSPIDNTEDAYDWLGLNPYPQPEDSGVYSVPYPNGKRPDYRMGMTFINRFKAQGMTFACATCHSARLFGKTVLGMTNRFPRANKFFVFSKSAVQKISPWMFRLHARPTSGELTLYREARNHLKRVGARSPVVLGLDTSLAHTALSLAHRGQDPYATPAPKWERQPRSEPLSQFVADSKPAVWWNLKYKNRWLSDGSLVSGNPIFTNFLWNEVGRGTDLHDLEKWLDTNRSTVVRDLTTAVFSMEAPRYTDFFSAASISLRSAKRGEIHFNRLCSRCHGVYLKKWSLPTAPLLPLEARLENWKVLYPNQTPIRNVGTDPQRWQGMKSLLQLNQLAIHQKNQIQVKTQKGYVPPPLVGIWARWPYFHNNSVPSLCAVLTAGKKRPSHYWAGPAEDPQTDFDPTCNGYPQGSSVPEIWKEKYKEAYYETSRPGQSNSGHDEGIFLKNGEELLSPESKLDLIEYLKTL